VSKLDDLQKDLESVDSEIKELSGFRDTPFVRKFRRQLQGERSFILNTISKITRSKESSEQERIRRISKANLNRSAKMKRNWNYFKEIQKNYYPDKSLKEIRKLHKAHRQGLETDVSDLVWRNPSP